MNERFFTLPPERQSAIINAAFRVFSASDYKHASMSAIADAGRISKSLLFHYFGNKEGLYRYLWDYATAKTVEATADCGVRETSDPFEMLRRTTRAKCEVMRRSPYLNAFATRAYYETEPLAQKLIQGDVARYAQNGQAMFEDLCDPAYLAEGVTPGQLFQDFLMLSDGYMLQKYRNAGIDADAIEADFMDIIDRWERFFGKGAAHA